MTPEQMQAVFIHPVSQAVAVLVVVSCAWYYVSSIRKGATARNMLVGSPIKLLIIILLVIAILVITNVVMTGGLWI